ncbi:PREDICTED: slit homolog 3 protein-like [Branchiostoma belcheri]|uniref:Slit homolog 3 protein-like n=1 Tax=Branchiostoma belcheri TaxID=7741 RepID=A0A6P4YGK7_BRABE|nr:PREDICTED: slit homolog 3 protein-like [Branchiostoma belcheri]
MKVSVRTLLVILGFLWTGCLCLPDGCEVSKFKYSSMVLVDCNKLGLVTVPSDLPANTVQFKISYNNIKNVTYLPALKNMYSLDLSFNSIESMSWMSLRTLPDLSTLELQKNRLKYVELDIVIAHLPKLKFVNLSLNKLASFSQYAMGWPQVTTIVIYKNPFHCDCDLSWLIIKMACLKACKGKDRQACCSSCSACFLNMTPKGRFNCKSPSDLHGRHLSTVSTQLTGCGTTHQAETRPTEHRKCSVGIPTSDSPVMTNASTTGKTLHGKEENSHKYIAIFILEKCISVAFIICLVRLMIKKKLCYNRREAAGIGADRPTIHSHQIVPPIENNVYNETVAEGSKPRQPVAHQIALPIENTVNQCTSTQGMDDEDSVPPGENESTPSPENSENHSAVELYHETMAVSEQCVEVDRTQTAESAVYTCTEPTASSTNYMYNTSAEVVNHGHHDDNENNKRME